jgi:hypothetical protein
MRCCGTSERVFLSFAFLACCPILIQTDRADQEFGNIVPGVFTPVLTKHSKSFSLIDCISVGVGRMQRNFEPMRKQVEGWQRSELTDVTAKVVIYEAFSKRRSEVGGSEAPRPRRA